MRFRRILVLGGVRSGKSRLAQNLVEASGKRKVFIATGEAHDGEMSERIALHRQSRGAGWQTVEEPLALAEAILRQDGDAAVVVDCLTLWLSNVMLAGGDPEEALSGLERAIRDTRSTLVLVSNEVGMGIVPETVLGRQFRDWQGRVNQAVAETCDAAVMMVAGQPLLLKPSAVAGIGLG